MGQQVPFETLDEVARGLCGAIERAGGTVEMRTATTVRVGCETLQRLELDVQRDGKPAAPIHLYEAYWAPLTEGAAGLWQVVRFLLAGGWNGLRSDARLNRFMFGKPRQFRINRWSLAGLALVIATVVAVLIVGGTIATVAAARLTLDTRGWANDDLVRELTTLFERLVGVITGSAAVAIILIALGRWVLPRSGQNWRYQVAWFLNALVAVPMVIIILALLFTAYVGIPVIFSFNEGPPFVTRPCAWCPPFAASTFEPWGPAIASWGAAVRRFVEYVLQCTAPERAAWWFLVGLGSVLVMYALYSLVTRTRRTGNAVPRGRGGQAAGLAMALLVLAAVLALCGHSDALAFVTWVLLFAAVLFVRSFLIQFVGDVAIYVSPHVVDRFFDVRARIKKMVWSAARAVYACPDDAHGFLYEDVVIVGHSLGSVIVYDALNRLINEDDLAGGSPTQCCDDAPVEHLRVETRTRLLLTFGSPLDKTAFIFARHNRHVGSERDALAASVQPLIARNRVFPWVNVWSPFDILGGPLEFYDTPKGEAPNPYRVVNVPDPRAITPITAHNEFWKNALIYDAMYEHLR